MVSIPNDLWVAIRNVSIATITNDTCNDFVVSWCARIILQSNTLSELEHKRRDTISIVYLLCRQTKRDQETLTL
ncbi:MAG: hypothetical protein UHE86_01300 [Acutalibacteraceae bacterium]|nr:hypothetical protein [Acutalibacteraceae bacterium]